MTLAAQLLSLDACNESVLWADEHSDLTPDELWATCPKPHWMMWLIARLRMPGMYETAIQCVLCRNDKERFAAGLVRDYVTHGEAGLSYNVVWEACSFQGYAGTQLRDILCATKESCPEDVLWMVVDPLGIAYQEELLAHAGRVIRDRHPAANVIDRLRSVETSRVRRPQYQDQPGECL